MAEVAAGLIIAEEVITNSLYVGVGYGIVKRTFPLKATYKCFSTVPQLETPDSLARFSHSGSVVDGSLYIFGGLVTPEKLAGNEVHILKLAELGDSGSPQYKAVPALADDDQIPQPRAGHSACVSGQNLVVFGGYGDASSKNALDESGKVWLFDTAALHWKCLSPANVRYPVACNHSAVVHGRKLFIAGGQQADAKTNVWSFHLDSHVWLELPALTDDSEEVTARDTNLAVADETLYAILSTDDGLASQILAFDVSEKSEKAEWTRVEIPTNPLTPGPRPRKGAGLLPISTGMGRTFLLYMLGEKEEGDGAGKSDEGEREFWSGLWTLQLPSASTTPASVKDASREKIGMDSGEMQWAEVEIVARDEAASGQGKSHPGPRGHFSAATLAKDRVVLWGGLGPHGTAEGDGWVIELKV